MKKLAYLIMALLLMALCGCGENAAVPEKKEGLAIVTTVFPAFDFARNIVAENGTVTLLVNVMCPDKHTDHLFEHEVTMRMEPDGSFQYLSNRIIYQGEAELPSPQARIEAQRFDA